MTQRAAACRDYLRQPLSRRAMLAAGAVGLGGLSLSNLLRAETSPSTKTPQIAGGKPAAGNSAEKTPTRLTSFGHARSCILLFQFGGPSQFETFDPKPNAPAEIRGQFGVISTANPELHIGEHLPKLAKLADRFALVRSVYHDRSSHNPGAYYSLTGRRPLNPNVTANAAATDFPAPGAVIDYLHQNQKDKPQVPTAVSLPTMIADGPFRTPGEFAGFLGKMHDPLFITQDPNNDRFSVDQLSLPGGVSVERLRKRQAMLAELSRASQLDERHAAVRGMDAYQQRAFDLLTSPATERALAISKEHPKTRDRYGRHQYGQSVLLARRLVEAGVRFVTVYYSAGIGGWDTHKDNFNTLKGSRLPHTDSAMSALIEDLCQRGLFDETLILWTGDFGRTPQVNKDAGRDHWPPCQTVLLAGGGVTGGALVGQSDKSGAYPLEDPHLPDDVMATVYHALGIDHHTTIRDQLSRPMPLSDGKVIEKLFT